MVWDAQTCPHCSEGLLALERSSNPYVFICRACRKCVSQWTGSPFKNSKITVAKCYNICVGFSARLSVTQACVDKGLTRNAVSRYWKYFRAVEAWNGREKMCSTCFQGFKGYPVEVEMDETVVRKIKIYDDATKERTGTLHFAVWAMKQRGSRRTVAYVMKPRFVPVRQDNGAGAAAPPPDVEELLPWLHTHLGDWVIIHCDSARAYPALLEALQKTHEGLFLDMVNHGNHQWTRFHRHPVTGVQGVSRFRVVAGTNMIEGFWHVLKHHTLPAELHVDCALIEQYVQQLVHRQWSEGDPLKELGEITRRYMEAMGFDPFTNDPALCATIERVEDMGETEASNVLE